MFLIFCCFLVTWSAQVTSAECPPLITRKEWDASKPKKLFYLSNPVDLVIIEHTSTQTCSDDQNCAELVRDIQKIHIEKSFIRDIGPSFLVGGNGKVYEGRGWHYSGIHTAGFNNQSIGIAFIGNFNNQPPSQTALDAAKALIKCGVKDNELTPDHKIVIHSQLIPTESPGKKLATEVMSWPNWISDASEIKKKADKQETEKTDGQARTGKDLVLATPKHIDLLTNIRDVIAELIKNMSKLAHDTVDTVEALTIGMNKQVSLFIETLVSGLKKLRDEFGAAFSAISGIPGVHNCANALKDKSNNLYDSTEAKAKKCADDRVNEIEQMVKNLGTLSSDAIAYTNTAVDNTKDCTELNRGIESSTKPCLNSVTKQTETASKTYESQRSTMLNSINTLLKALPAALDLCAKQHLLVAGAENAKIAAELSQCPTKNIPLPKLGFGF